MLPVIAPGEVSPPAPCADVGTSGATLRGAERDPRYTWLEGPTVPRIELVWPAGYRAQFAPQLVVVAEDGRIVAQAGDPVPFVCVAQAGGSFVPLKFGS